MTRKILSIAAACLMVFAVAACRTATVYNVENASFTSAGQVSLENVEKAITRAAVAQGWQVRKEADGHMVATLPIRSHVAVVDILYDTQNFSIHYKDSTNLKYENGTIHSNYNTWIQKLESGIKSQITLL